MIKDRVYLNFPSRSWYGKYSPYWHLTKTQDSFWFLKFQEPFKSFQPDFLGFKKIVADGCSCEKLGTIPIILSWHPWAYRRIILYEFNFKWLSTVVTSSNLFLIFYAFRAIIKGRGEKIEQTNLKRDELTSVSLPRSSFFTRYFWMKDTGILPSLWWESQEKLNIW